VQAEHLDDALDKRLDPPHVEVALQRLVQLVLLICLFGLGRQARVQKRLVESTVEPVRGDLVRLGELLDQHEGLDARVEVGRVRDAEEGVEMFGKSGRMRMSTISHYVSLGEKRVPR
jgi:hypothetical protein